MQRPILNNVTGVGELNYHAPFDLELIARKVSGSRLNLKKFAGLIIRKTKPSGTLILFKSKKYLIIGCDSLENCEILSKKIVKDLQKILCVNTISNKCFRIANLIASANLGYHVNVHRIAELPNAYKDDKIKGVFLKMTKVKSVIVFESGKMMFNGTTKYDSLEETFDELVKELKEFENKDSEITAGIKKKTTRMSKNENTKRKGKSKLKSLNSDYEEETSQCDDDEEDSENECTRQPETEPPRRKSKRKEVVNSKEKKKIHNYDGHDE